MNSYEIPRNYKGEGRFFYVFSTKGLIYTVVGLMLGYPIYLIFKINEKTFIGFLIMALLGFIGFAIATFKIPESNSLSITRKAGGERIDTIIVRWFKFKRNKDRIFIYKEMEEDTKDEQ